MKVWGIFISIPVADDGNTKIVAFPCDVVILSGGEHSYRSTLQGFCKDSTEPGSNLQRYGMLASARATLQWTFPRCEHWYQHTTY